MIRAMQICYSVKDKFSLLSYFGKYCYVLWLLDYSIVAKV